MEFKKTKIGVDVYGEKFEVRVLSVDEQQGYYKKVTEAGEDESRMFEVMFEYIERCGVPKVTAEKMEIDHLTQLITFVTSGKKN